MDFRSRRMLAMTCTWSAVGLTGLAVQWTRNRLGDESTLTGWTLLVSTAGLYLLAARKRCVTARLGPVAAWLQVHVYMGTFAALVFLMHIGWPVRGWFESSLAACFAIVAVSGIWLGILSRTTPKRLAALAVDHRLERIPALQAAVAHDAHGVALSSSKVGEGATLAEFYQRRLIPFFQSPRGLLYRMVPSGIQRRQLLRELDDLARYLADDGNAGRVRLAELVQTKDDLDYQLALQSRLRWWYAAHMSLTWALALLIAVHVVLVYRFQGAM